MKNIVLFLIFSAIFLLGVNVVNAVDYRNAYMMYWDGTACENVQYAKSMGYDYIGYQTGMEKCANNTNLYFYLESPEQDFSLWRIGFYDSYTSQQKTEANNLFLWKSTATFPYNLATGWFFGTNYFRPVVDFQQQKNIDYMVNRSLAKIKRSQNLANNFKFGGYSWDVPSLEGDLWSKQQDSGGAQINITYWTKTCSGIKHSGIIQNYACYRDGKAAFYKKLFSETKKLYPNMKTYMSPWLPWSSYMRDIYARPDVQQLKPDMLCQESGGTQFVTDTRIFATGLMTKDKVCSDTPNVFDHKGNLVIAGNAGVNGAWFLWFGRLGGTGNFPNYASMKDIPDRLKLIRAMPGWDNLNSVPLSSRSWDATKLQYKSSLSYADMNIIYSVHAKSKNTYFVILNQSTGMPLNGKTRYTVYSVDGLFQQKVVATSDFTVINGKLCLKSGANVGKGYIIKFN